VEAFLAARREEDSRGPPGAASARQ
jgi:hypothetical protein